MSGDFETWQIHMGVNTYSDGRPNVYFICQDGHDGLTHHRNVDRGRIVSFDEVSYKGDFDWGQRLDYLATVTLTRDEVTWVRNHQDST